MIQCNDQKKSVGVPRGGCPPHFAGIFWPSDNSTTTLLSVLSSICWPAWSSTRMRHATASLRLNWFASTQNGPAWPSCAWRAMDERRDAVNAALRVAVFGKLGAIIEQLARTAAPDLGGVVAREQQARGL